MGERETNRKKDEVNAIQGKILAKLSLKTICRGEIFTFFVFYQQVQMNAYNFLLEILALISLEAI